MLNMISSKFSASRGLQLHDKNTIFQTKKVLLNEDLRNMLIETQVS